MNPEKIQQLSRVPRTVTKEFEKISAKPFFFLPWAVRSWEQEMTNSPLVFAVVVQANECLFDARESEFAPAVLAWTTSPTHAQDIQWLGALADRIHGCTSNATNMDEAKLGALLMAEDSSISLDVPTSLTGGVRVRMCSLWIDPTTLPGKAIPEHRCLPVLVSDDSPTVIPPSFYL